MADELAPRVTHKLVLRESVLAERLFAISAELPRRVIIGHELKPLVIEQARPTRVAELPKRGEIGRCDEGVAIASELSQLPGERGGPVALLHVRVPSLKIVNRLDKG